MGRAPGRLRPRNGYRVVQLTPPGSACSIIFGNAIASARPGSIDRLVLVQGVAVSGELPLKSRTAYAAQAEPS